MYINIDLSSRWDVRPAYIVGREGESLINGFEFILPEEYRDWALCLDIERPDGMKYRVQVADYVNCLGRYLLTSQDLEKKGNLKVDVILINGEVIFKPWSYVFAVKDAICATENGEYVPTIALTNEIIEEIHTAAQWAHYHDNKDTLDEIGEDEEGSLTFNGNKVTPNGVDDTFVEEANDAIEKAHTHDNKSTLDEIGEDEVGALTYNGERVTPYGVDDEFVQLANVAIELAHDHDNKETLDNIGYDPENGLTYNGERVSSQKLTDDFILEIENAVELAHDHDNKETLDKFDERGGVIYYGDTKLSQKIGSLTASGTYNQYKYRRKIAVDDDGRAYAERDSVLLSESPNWYLVTSGRPSGYSEYNYCYETSIVTYDDADGFLPTIFMRKSSNMLGNICPICYCEKSANLTKVYIFCQNQPSNNRTIDGEYDPVVVLIPDRGSEYGTSGETKRTGRVVLVNNYTAGNNISLAGNKISVSSNGAAQGQALLADGNGGTVWGIVSSDSSESDVFWVTYNGTTLDKTFAEMKAAHNDKKIVAIIYNSTIFDLIVADTSMLKFATQNFYTRIGQTDEASIAFITVSSSDSVNYYLKNVELSENRDENSLSNNRKHYPSSQLLNSLLTGVNTDISSEATARQAADTALQSQIDTLILKSDVVDLVSDVAALQAYNTSGLFNNDIVMVLADENHDGVKTYYRWVITNGVGEWIFLNVDNTSYSKSEIDELLNAKVDTELVKSTPTTDNKIMTEADVYIQHLGIREAPGANSNSYLFEADYSSDDYDYSYASSVFESRFVPVGECSAVRAGDYVGRNYDWYYNESAEFIVRTPAKNGRNATIGVAQSSALTKDKVVTPSGEDYEAYRLLPFLTLDGINDKGVYANINVTALGDRGEITGTNPGNERLCGLLLVRYVLDYASSADEAISLLSNKDIWFPHTDTLSEEFHFLISDEQKSYVVEFVDNQMVYHLAEDADNNPAAILTNFSTVSADGTAWFDGTYVDRTSATENDDFFKASEHPMGVERFDILKTAFAGISDKDTMKEAMESVKYSKSYDNTVTPFWYSEFSGDQTAYGYGDLTWGTSVSDYESFVEAAINAYQEEHTNEERTGRTWQTVHTSVYDIKNRVLSVWTQEDYSTEFVYYLNNEKQDVIDEDNKLPYDYISNKPQINGVELSGNKTSADLGIEGGKIVNDKLVIKESSATTIASLGLGAKVYIPENGINTEYWLVEKNEQNIVLLRKNALQQKYKLSGSIRVFDYATSPVDSFLAGDFQNRFTDGIKANFVEKSIRVRDASELYLINRKVFIPSAYEMNLKTDYGDGDSNFLTAIKIAKGDTTISDDEARKYNIDNKSDESYALTRTYGGRLSGNYYLICYDVVGASYTNERVIDANYVRPAISVSPSTKIDNNNVMLSGTIAPEATEIDYIQDGDKYYKIKDLSARSALEGKVDTSLVKTAPTSENKILTEADYIESPPEISIGDTEPTGDEVVWYNTSEEEEEDPEDVATIGYVDTAIEEALGDVETILAELIGGESV